MFYEIDLPQRKPGVKPTAALVVLNPAESRRLLARAVVATPEVKWAWQNGTIIIARGITSAFVTEELLNIKVEHKANQTVGFVGGGMTNANGSPPASTWHVIRKGKVVENADTNVEIQSFMPGDLFIKGANAVDHTGASGVWVASRKAGSIGMAWPILAPRGCDMLVTVSLEKLIPSVEEASRHSGIYHFRYSMGIPCRLVPESLAKVITEIQAFGILAGVRAYHVGSGGIAGSEGSVQLCLEGDEASLAKAFEVAKSVKGEPPVGMPAKPFLSKPADYGYDAQAQLDLLGGI